MGGGCAKRGSHYAMMGAVDLALPGSPDQLDPECLFIRSKL